MFSTSGFGGGIFSSIDPDSERDPPAQPTNLSFPRQYCSNGTDWTSTCPDLQDLFATINKPLGISKDHLDALNIQMESQPCQLDDFVPVSSGGNPYLPPLLPQDAASRPTATEGSVSSCGIPPDLYKPFKDRLVELQTDNDVIYRVLTRTRSRNGEKLPRIAYMRRFCEGLEQMSHYWDCSLDQYYEQTPSEDSMQVESGRKRQRLSPKGNETVAVMTAASTASRLSEHTVALNKQCEGSAAYSEKAKKRSPKSHAVDDNEFWSDTDQDRCSRSGSCTPELHPQNIRYKGYRTASGRDMPDSFRLDTVRGFVEGTLHPFRYALAPPRRMPKVQIGRLNIPVRQSAIAYRVPKDRRKAREMYIEGPLLGIQVRADIDFDHGTEAQRDNKAILDQIREIGGLLQLAQERHREGKVERRPGEGKWYTMKPRWGGAPDDRSRDDELTEADKEEILGVIEGVMSGKREQSSATSKDRPMKKTPALLWRELKPGSSRWDARTDYMAIGKEASSPYDQVFMVSSLNTHISILKLIVHDAYLDYLITGIRPQEGEVAADWSQPRLQRTQWFNLFDVCERVEAYRTLWGVMCYLTRESRASVEQVNGTEMTMR